MSDARVARWGVALAIVGVFAAACSSGAHSKEGFLSNEQPSTNSSPSGASATTVDASVRAQADATVFGGGDGAPVLPSTQPSCSANPTAVGCPCATLGATNACSASGCTTGSQACMTFGAGETAHSAWGPCTCAPAGDGGGAAATGSDAGVAIDTVDAAAPPDPPLTAQMVCANPDSAQLNAFLQGLAQGQLDIQLDAGPSCCVQCTGCVPGAVIWSYDSCTGTPEYCVQTIQQTCQPDGTWGPPVETGANYVSGCIHFWDGCDLNDGAGSYAGDCDGVFAGCNAPLSSCPGSGLTNDFGNADPLPPLPQ